MGGGRIRVGRSDELAPAFAEASARKPIVIDVLAQHVLQRPRFATCEGITWVRLQAPRSQTFTVSVRPWYVVSVAGSSSPVPGQEIIEPANVMPVGHGLAYHKAYQLADSGQQTKPNVARWPANRRRLTSGAGRTSLNVPATSASDRFR